MCEYYKLFLFQKFIKDFYLDMFFDVFIAAYNKIDRLSSCVQQARMDM